MSAYLCFGSDPEGEQIASNQGWSRTCDWVYSLPEDAAAEFKHLCSHGWSQNLNTLALNVREVVKSHPPQDAQICDTLDGLLGVLRRRPNDVETCTVSDGTGT